MKPIPSTRNLNEVGNPNLKNNIKRRFQIL